MADVWANSMACHPRATYHIPGCCHLANSMSWSQSYVSHCRVLPLGEFTVMIPEPHATLHVAWGWRNQCHDRATLQGVRIPSAILKIVFFLPYFIYFLFLMQFGLWRAAAFVSSPIRLFIFKVDSNRKRKIVKNQHIWLFGRSHWGLAPFTIHC